MATLDSDPDRLGSDLSFTLACLGSMPVGYLGSYSGLIPDNVDEYRIGIWDDSEDAWIGPLVESSVILADDGSGVSIPNRAILRAIVSPLQQSADGLPEGQHLNAIAFDYDDGDDVPSLWSEFDAAGLTDALSYVGCYRG